MNKECDNEMLEPIEMDNKLLILVMGLVNFVPFVRKHKLESAVFSSSKSVLTKLTKVH